MEIKTLKISQIDTNKGQVEGLPKNPRFIRDENFARLMKSIADAPEMLSLRELIVYPVGRRFICIAGNMRLRACRELGMQDVPCKVLAKDTPVEKLREYAIKDNNPFGEDDWDVLANEWDTAELEDWGLTLPTDWGADIEPEGEEESQSPDASSDDEEETDVRANLDTPPDLLFASNNPYDIPALLPNMQGGQLEMPITPWGSNSRLRADVSTYHFYVDDYRFNKVWREPHTVANSGVHSLVEPNYSMHDQTPTAWAMHLVYKKRWLSRWWQEHGIRIYVDLFVAPKFAELNLCGVPQGWNAFFTRGESYIEGRLEADLDTARRVNGKDSPNLIVYGGGEGIKQRCQQLGLLYIENFMSTRSGEMKQNKQ